MIIAILGPYVPNSKIEGGVERHLKNLIDEFNGFDIHVFSISKNGKNNIQKIRKNITLHIVKSIRLPMTITGITVDLYNLIKEINKIKPDLVHGQMVGAPYGIATYFLAKRYPSILTIHTLIRQNTKVKRTLKSWIHDALWHFLEKSEIKGIKNIITVSEHLKPDISSMGCSRIYSIPNGIKPEWLKIESKYIDGRILFVGRILPIKGLENLIMAIHIIKKKRMNINLHIVGPYLDVEYFNRLQRLMIDLNIQDNVIFTGPLYGKKLIKEYSESQIFVLPSHDESNPFVLIEAMAAGIPIVATAVGGIPYLINEGENGFLVKDNDVEDMAGRMMHLLNQRDVRNGISIRNKERAKLFLWSHIASQTVELYKKIINNNKSYGFGN